MKDAFRSVRGTSDLFPRFLAQRRRIENELRTAVELFGYTEIETPILEHSFLFERGLGQGSEVVSKEMFRIESRGNASNNQEDQVVLRPENTASVLRAVLNAGLQHSLPLHVFYCGPQFRYERPQKGRAREFHQFGVECIGRGSAMGDAECILTAVEGLKRLGLLNKTKLKMNTLGESEASRQRYNQVLLDHFSQWNKTDLSAETKLRIKEKRILRALDSKSKLDVECIQTAPNLIDYLPAGDVSRFNEVIAILRDEYKVDCEIELDTRLVRGLDYYSHTCFEFVSKEDGLTCLAGGRYDGLAKTLGYTRSPVPSIGWAAGLERLNLLLNHDREPPALSEVKLLLVPVYEGEASKDKSIRETLARIAAKARADGVSARIWGGLFGDTGAVKKALKEADNIKALGVCFLGSSEVQVNKVSIRDVAKGTVANVDIDSSPRSWIK